jgi:hypothetical protein
VYDAPPGLLTTLGWVFAGLVALLGAARAVAVERRAWASAATGGAWAGAAATVDGAAPARKEMSGIGVTFTVVTALAIGVVGGVLAAVVAAGLG